MIKFQENIPKAVSHSTDKQLKDVNKADKGTPIFQQMLHQHQTYQENNSKEPNKMKDIYSIEEKGLHLMSSKKQHLFLQNKTSILKEQELQGNEQVQKLQELLHDIKSIMKRLLENQEELDNGLTEQLVSLLQQWTEIMPSQKEMESQFPLEQVLNNTEQQLFINLLNYINGDHHSLSQESQKDAKIQEMKDLIQDVINQYRINGIVNKSENLEAMNSQMGSKEDTPYLLNWITQNEKLFNKLMTNDVQQLSQNLSQNERNILQQLLSYVNKGEGKEKPIAVTSMNLHDLHKLIDMLSGVKTAFTEELIEQQTKIMNKSEWSAKIDMQPTPIALQNNNNHFESSNVQQSWIVTSHTTDIKAPLPLSKIEQYMLYARQMDKVEQVGQQISNKLSTIVNETQFLKTGPPSMQLSIGLNPTNLGKMTIRFIQLEGELTVQMLVTSNATKKILESNLHQLKAVFAPHQVVIDRDEQITDEEFYRDDDGYEEQQEEHTPDDQYDERHDKGSKNKETIDFESLFQIVKKEGGNWNGITN